MLKDILQLLQNKNIEKVFSLIYIMRLQIRVIK